MVETVATYTVPEHHIIQFTSNVQAALQRQGGELAGMVSSNTYTGDKSQVVNFLGPISFIKRDGPYQDTKVTEPEHTQRWITADDYDTALFIDRIDTLRMIYDPTNPYVERVREAAARLQDEVIMSAFFDVARTGKQGVTTVSFPAQDTVPFGGTRMSVSKLRAVRKLIKKRYNNLRTQRPVMALSAEQQDDLLGELPVASVDYNSVKPLTDGEVSSFMGFTFVPQEDIIPSRIDTTSGSHLVRQCPVWLPDGMHMGDWQSLVITINNRPDKNNIKQIHGCMSLGATRLQEGKVFMVECQET
jgi:hypothetical protein